MSDVNVNLQQSMYQESSNPIVELGVRLSELLLKNTVQSIQTKISAVKAKNESAVTINTLEEIINELIDERNELIRISTSYNELLGSQRISQNDIEYITNNVIPLISQVLSKTDNSDQQKVSQIASTIEVLKPLLSVETFTIMQILGFNFKQALGEPLTKLIEKSILNENNSRDLEKGIEAVNQQNVILGNILNAIQDQESYDKFKELYNK